MTKNNTIESTALLKRLKSIKKYLTRYEKKLFSLMESLETDENLEQSAKTLEAVVGRLEKVAMKFFELGCKLDEFKAREEQRGVLDTQAARKEILERLDRIRASQISSEGD